VWWPFRTVQSMHSNTSMTKADWVTFLVIGVLLMLSLVVYAQPTVDDGESCEFPAFDETARDVKLMKEDLSEVKNIARNVEEMKNLLASRQQSCSAIDSSILSEYKTHSLLGMRVHVYCLDLEIRRNTLLYSSNQSINQNKIYIAP